MTDFSARIWQRTTPLREAIHALPFNTELAAGRPDEILHPPLLPRAAFLAADFAVI